MNIFLDDLLYLTIGKDLIVAVDVELGVENRMAVGDAGLPSLLVIGPAESSGVSELKSDD